MNFTAANYAVSDTATGRGTMQLAFTFGGTPDTLNFVFYVVNSGKLFVMESDTFRNTTRCSMACVVQQQIPAGGFSNASLNGNMVIYLTGLSTCTNVPNVPKAGAGFAHGQRQRRFSLTYDEKLLPGAQRLHQRGGDVQRGQQRAYDTYSWRIQPGGLRGELESDFPLRL